MIDTVMKAGNIDDNEDKFEQAPDPAYFAKADRQWDWLNKTLAALTADHLIVSGHYPIWSACSHGPTYRLVDRLKLLLETYGARYVIGNERCARHIDEGSGPKYIVTGAGK